MTVKNFVDDLEGLRRGLHLGKINLLGHSWGGLLAMDYVIKYPAKVGKIILVSSIGAASDWVAPFVHNRESRRTFQDSVALAKLTGSEAFGKRAPPVMEQFARLFFKSYFYTQSLADSLTITFTPETAKNFLSIFGLMSREITHYDIRSKLHELTCPVLILHGEDDPVPLETAKEVQSSIPGSKLVVLGKCGHFPFIESPKDFFDYCEKFLGNDR